MGQDKVFMVLVYLTFMKQAINLKMPVLPRVYFAQYHLTETWILEKSCLP